MLTTMKLKKEVRRHHNNKGLRQIKNGRPAKEMKILAKKLGVKYGYIKPQTQC